MSIWHTYAARVSKPPELEVIYFGLTQDGVHSFDVYGTPPGRERRLLGVIKRMPDKPGQKRPGGRKTYRAWRNGVQRNAETLSGAAVWIVKLAAYGGEVLFPEEKVDG